MRLRLRGFGGRNSRLRRWLRRRSTKTLIVLAVLALGLLALAGGAVYAALGGTSHPQSTNDIELQRGLVGWWKWNGNTKDSTPYGDNGTISGTATAATDREGKTSGAYSFASGTNSISAPMASSVSYGAGLTLSAWINPSSYPSERSTIIEGESPNSYYLSLYTDGSVQAYWYNKSNPGYFTTAAGVIPLNQWSLVTVTWDSSNARLYVNGVLSATSTTTTGTGAVPSVIVFGAESSARQFIGSLDDERIYNRPLSSAEVAVLDKEYDAQINSASGENGLIGEWKLDGNTKDSTPYGHNGTLNGTITATTDREGATNSAYNFDGGGSSYMSAPVNTAQQGSHITLSIWAKSSGSGSNAPRGIMINTTATYIDECFSGQVLFSLYAAGPSQQLITGGSCPATGVWHLYTATYDGTTARLYIDGVQVGSLAYSSTIYHDGTPLTIGGYSSGYTFNGSLDDARMYNRALSAAEVKNLFTSYNSQINLQSSPTNNQTVNLNSGLVGYWPFSSNAKDATPYSRNGTVTGAVLTTDRKGLSNSAYSFSGSGQYIDAGASPITGTQPFSLSAWIKTNSVSNYSGALSIGVSGGAQSAYIGTVSTAQVGTSNSIGGGFYGTNIGSGVTTTGAWVHVALTFSGGSGGTVIMYVNGTATNTTTFTPSLLAGNLRIGRIGTDTIYDFNGSVDDVRLYNRALTATEVQALHNNYY